MVCVCVGFFCWERRRWGMGWKYRRFFVVVLRNNTLLFFFCFFCCFGSFLIFLVVVCSSSKKERAVLGVVRLWMGMTMTMTMVDIHMADCEERGRVWGWGPVLTTLSFGAKNKRRIWFHNAQGQTHAHTCLWRSWSSHGNVIQRKVSRLDQWMDGGATVGEWWMVPVFKNIEAGVYKCLRFKE